MQILLLKKYHNFTSFMQFIN